MLLVVRYLEECLTVHLYLPLPGDESCRITQCCTGIEDHFRAVRQDYGGSHSHRIHHLYHLAVQFLVTFMERDIIGDAEQKRDGGADILNQNLLRKLRSIRLLTSRKISSLIASPICFMISFLVSIFRLSYNEE